MPMRLFNSINNARMQCLAAMINAKKDEVAPNIDKVITYYIKFVRNEKKKIQIGSGMQIKKLFRIYLIVMDINIALLLVKY